MFLMREIEPLNYIDRRLCDAVWPPTNVSEEILDIEQAISLLDEEIFWCKNEIKKLRTFHSPYSEYSEWSEEEINNEIKKQKNLLKQRCSERYILELRIDLLSNKEPE